MINYLWRKSGNLAFFLTMPLLAIYLRQVRRTRVVLTCDQKVLVARGWLGDGKWILPGGGLHKGEDKVVGAIREVYEETGLQLSPDDLKFEDELAYHKGLFKVDYDVFSASYHELAKVRPQRFEILDVEWVELALLTADNSADETLVVLRKLAKIA